MIDPVYLVTRKHLKVAADRYPDAANEIKAWAAIVAAARWQNFAEVSGVIRDADYVDGDVVFNFRQNCYRLITVIHYAKRSVYKETQGHVDIRSFLTHKEYNNPANCG